MTKIRSKQRFLVGLYATTVLAAAVFLAMGWRLGTLVALLAMLMVLGGIIVFQNYSARLAAHRAAANKQTLNSIAAQLSALQGDVSAMSETKDALDSELGSRKEAQAPTTGNEAPKSAREGQPRGQSLPTPSAGGDEADSERPVNYLGEEIYTLLKKMEFTERRVVAAVEAQRTLADDRWATLRRKDGPDPEAGI